MANLKKYTRSAQGHLFAHYERLKDENGEYVKFGNKKIDPDRTHLNYNLAAEDQKLSSGEFMKKRLSEVFCQNRKDVNVFCSWVVDAPSDMPREEYKEFFKYVYEFLCNRYGRENVVSAYVHMDETTPHMHFVFIPVCKDKKRGEKVCAKKVCSKTDLESFHTDLSKHLERMMGRDVGVLNGATIDGNRSVEQLKKISELENKLSELEAKEKVLKQVEQKEDELVKRISQKVVENISLEIPRLDEKVIKDAEILLSNFEVENFQTPVKKDPKNFFSQTYFKNGSRLKFKGFQNSGNALRAQEILDSLKKLIDFRKEFMVNIRLKITQAVEKETKKNIKKMIVENTNQAREYRIRDTSREKKKNHDRDRE